MVPLQIVNVFITHHDNMIVYSYTSCWWADVGLHGTHNVSIIYCDLMPNSSQKHSVHTWLLSHIGCHCNPKAGCRESKHVCTSICQKRTAISTLIICNIHVNNMQSLHTISIQALVQPHQLLLIHSIADMCRPAPINCTLSHISVHAAIKP